MVIKHIQKAINSKAREWKITEKPSVKKMTNVQHLYTPIHFKTDSQTYPLQILKNLHPTPALGGYPREKTVHYLQDNCLINRGWFGGPVGWINSKGTGEFTVAIRSGLVGKYNAKLFAGCGIMADSDPQSEWEESKLKFKPMLSALMNE